jgi:hypothetical protein
VVGTPLHRLLLEVLFLDDVHLVEAVLPDSASSGNLHAGQSVQEREGGEEVVKTDLGTRAELGL